MDEDEILDNDSFLLEASQAGNDAIEPRSSLRKMSRASRGVSENGWETDDDTPNQRRSTVTINEFPMVSTTSPGFPASNGSTVGDFLGMSSRTPPPASILSPQPLRIQTPITGILGGDAFPADYSEDQDTLKVGSTSSHQPPLPPTNHSIVTSTLSDDLPPVHSATASTPVSGSTTMLNSAFRSLAFLMEPPAVAP